ncbi:ribosome-binding factor A [Clostridium sp. CAG:921]|nr:ribosome-binding factor A [Clostridium sp. CAG:921]
MQRHERLEQDVKIALSNIITYEVKEPSVTGLISVTDVKITPDQKYAKVYISIFGKQNKQKVIDALKKATGFIKLELGKRVRMRNIPSIMFELDDSIEYGDHMDKLIDEVIRNDEEKHSLSSEKTDEEKQI